VSTQEAFEIAIKTINSNVSKRSQAAAAMIATDAIVSKGEWARYAICKKGCSHCCHQPVAITPQEAALIGDYIGRKPSKPRHQKYDRESRDPCPFLKDNACSIYKVRPIACRTFFTYDDVEFCKVGDVNHRIATIESNASVVKLCAELMRKCNSKDADIREFFR